MQHPPVKGAAPPRTPLVEGAAPPGIYFGTLRRVGLRKTTDVLEFSSALMEQRTLDTRGVLQFEFWTQQLGLVPDS